MKLVEEECETCEPELTEEIVPRFICSTRVSAECLGGSADTGRWTERCERGKGRMSRGRKRKEPRKPRGHDEMIVRQLSIIKNIFPKLLKVSDFGLSQRRNVYLHATLYLCM